MATPATVVTKLQAALAEAQDVADDPPPTPDCALVIAKLQLAIAEAQELGGGLPDWVPPPGQRKNISFNFLKDVDPCPLHNCAFCGTAGPQKGLFAWSGATYVEDDGPYGSIGFTGGGHGDYFGNEHYRFPFDTRRWTRTTEPSPYPGNPLDAFGMFPDGRSAASHTYQHVQQLRAVDGGGPQGSTLLVCLSAAGQGAKTVGVAHRIDHATGAHTRYSTNVAFTTPTQQATIFDPLRKCYWKVGVGGQMVSMLNTSTKSWTDFNVGWAGGNNFSIEQVAAYYPAFDWMILLNYEGSVFTVWRLQLSSLAAGWKKLTFTGASPPASNSGPSFNYSPSLNKFCVYQRGDATIRYLVPPADQAGVWTFELGSFGGDAPVCSTTHGTRQTYNRMMWVEKLKSWAWFDGVDNPVQLWRPS